MRKTSILTALCLVLALILPRTLDAQVIVDAKKAWTKTKIAVAIDDKVKIQAAGTITLDPNVTCGADGLKIVSGPEHVLMKNVNRGALIAKIGKKGIPFHLGANGQFIAATAGLLYFGVNDDAVKNNSGTFNLNITINGVAK